MPLVRVSTPLRATPAKKAGVTERTASLNPEEISASPRSSAPRQMKSMFTVSVTSSTKNHAWKNARASTLRAR